MIEIANLVVGYSDISNITIFHFYTNIEFSLIFIFYMLFYKQYFHLKILYFVIPAFYVVSFVDYKLHGLNEIDSFSVTVESFVFLFISLMSFYFIIRHLIFENIVAMPFFWLNSAILIYFSGNILLFIFSKSLNTEDYYFLYSFINSPLNIIYNFLICVAFWKSRKK